MPEQATQILPDETMPSGEVPFNTLVGEVTQVAGPLLSKLDPFLTSNCFLSRGVYIEPSSQPDEEAPTVRYLYEFMLPRGKRMDFNNDLSVFLIVGGVPMTVEGVDLNDQPIVLFEASADGKGAWVTLPTGEVLEYTAPYMMYPHSGFSEVCGTLRRLLGGRKNRNDASYFVPENWGGEETPAFINSLRTIMERRLSDPEHQDLRAEFAQGIENLEASYEAHVKATTVVETKTLWGNYVRPRPDQHRPAIIITEYADGKITVTYEHSRPRQDKDRYFRYSTEPRTIDKEDLDTILREEESMHYYELYRFLTIKKEEGRRVEFEEMKAEVTNAAGLLLSNLKSFLTPNHLISRQAFIRRDPQPDEEASTGRYLYELKLPIGNRIDEYHDMSVFLIVGGVPMTVEGVDLSDQPIVLFEASADGTGAQITLPDGKILEYTMSEFGPFSSFEEAYGELIGLLVNVDNSRRTPDIYFKPENWRRDEPAAFINSLRTIMERRLSDPKHRDLRAEFAKRIKSLEASEN